MNDKPITAIMVSETHWDRAWYVPFQVFRMRLVRLIDRLIDILDQDTAYRSFMLDGQMVPVEDYLEIRPERRGDLERLVEAGRLFFGPWYALADEYLVSPESLVRNLMLGTRMAREFGGLMEEGYVPDAMGHIAQLPQILQGFGIDSAVFWRGMGDEGEVLGNEFWWEAPDGSRVLAIHLRDGYHNASNLGYPIRWGDPSALEFDMEAALAQVRQAVDRLKPHAHTPYVLLMNGIDHADPDPVVPNVIAQANEVLQDVQVEHSSLPDYIERVRQAVGSDLPTFRGEFTWGRYAVILQGVYSTRMYLKQANERCQTLLECYAEPLSAWAWVLGDTYPDAFLWAAWRKVLLNHPHDDIYGCSVDEVHREMMTRFGEAEQVGSVLVRDGFRSIVRAIDRTAQSGVPFVVFNPLAWSRTGTEEVSLLFDQHDTTADNFHLVDATGQTVPVQVLTRQAYFDMEVLKANRKQEVRLALALDAIPSCGYRVCFAQPGEVSPEVESPVTVLPGAGMENRYLRVEINADGTLEVLEKESQHRFQNQAYLSDDEDAGDAYDYSPCLYTENVSSLGGSAQVRLVHSGPLQITYEISLDLDLPVSLTEDRQRRSAKRVILPVTTMVTLRWDSRAVELRVIVDNRARDHRLRICFPTHLQTDEATAEGHFDAITRSLDLPTGEEWSQEPVPTKHQRTFVDVSDGQVGLAVFNRGLPEYQVLRDGGKNTVAVTLLRCVDAISRGGLLTRPEHAGIPCPAPEGQCLGEHTFEIAICPHRGDWHAVVRDAHTYRAPVILRRGDEHEGYVAGEVWTDHLPGGQPADSGTMKTFDRSGDLLPEQSFLTLEPASLVLSAVKRSEQGDRLIVRFYNPTAVPVQATVRLFRPIRSAQVVNLNEEPQEELVVDGEGGVTVSVSGKGIFTLALQV